MFYAMWDISRKPAYKFADWSDMVNNEHGFLVYSKWQLTLLHIIALATWRLNGNNLALSENL